MLSDPYSRSYSYQNEESGLGKKQYGAQMSYDSGFRSTLSTNPSSSIGVGTYYNSSYYGSTKTDSRDRLNNYDSWSSRLQNSSLTTSSYSTGSNFENKYYSKSKPFEEDDQYWNKQAYTVSSRRPRFESISNLKAGIGLPNIGYSCYMYKFTFDSLYLN